MEGSRRTLSGSTRRAMWRGGIWGLLALALIFSFAGATDNPASAQASCPALVDQALAAVGDNCDGLGRNMACYGHDLVSAEFTQVVAEDFFSRPADTAPLNDVRTIRASPMNPDESVWGVSLLNVQANIPDTLPGQVVRFLLLGDVQLENAVPPDEARAPANPVPAFTTVRLNVRSGPSQQNNVVAVIQPASSFSVDGWDGARRWLRATVDDKVGWVSGEFVQVDGDPDALPTLSESARTPMQAFRLNTGVGPVLCDDAPPDSMLVQGPEDIRVNLTVNGVDVRLASTMLLQGTPDSDVTVNVLAGEARVRNTTVRAGQAATFCAQGTVNCTDTAPTPIPAEVANHLSRLADLDTGIINYPVPVDERGVVLPTPVPTYAPPPTDAPPTPTQTPVSVDCSRFRASSPIGRVADGYSTFSWEPAPGATRYVVTVFRVDGSVLGRFVASGITTSTDVGPLTAGYRLTWKVDAYQGDRLVCSTRTVSLEVVRPQQPRQGTGQMPVSPTPQTQLMSSLGN